MATRSRGRCVGNGPARGPLALERGDRLRWTPRAPPVRLRLPRPRVPPARAPSGQRAAPAPAAVELAPQLLDRELQVRNQRFGAGQIRLGVGRLGAGVGGLGLHGERAARSAMIIAWALTRSAGSGSAARSRRDGNHIHRRPQAGSSSNRGGTPRCLGMTPVDPGQKVAELGWRDGHGAIGGARPQETAPFQPFCEQARALAVMPDDLQQIAATAAKAEQVAARTGVLPSCRSALPMRQPEPSRLKQATAWITPTTLPECSV